MKDEDAGRAQCPPSTLHGCAAHLRREKRNLLAARMAGPGVMSGGASGFRGLGVARKTDRRRSALRRDLFVLAGLRICRRRSIGLVGGLDYVEAALHLFTFFASGRFASTIRPTCGSLR